MAPILRNHADQHRPVGAMANLDRSARSAVLVVGLLAALSGCGLKGDLQAPEPSPATEANPHATRS